MSFTIPNPNCCCTNDPKHFCPKCEADFARLNPQYGRRSQSTVNNHRREVRRDEPLLIPTINWAAELNAERQASRNGGER